MHTLLLIIHPYDQSPSISTRFLVVAMVMKQLEIAVRTFGKELITRATRSPVAQVALIIDNTRMIRLSWNPCESKGYVFPHPYVIFNGYMKCHRSTSDRVNVTTVTNIR
jgi:hypothetical protein